MPVLDGSVGFEVRTTAGVARTLAYEKASNNAHLITVGAPLVKASTTQLVDLPVVSSGNVTSDKLLGFSATNDRASRAADLNSGFAQFPGPNRPDGNEEILVHVGDGVTEFFMALTIGTTATVALAGTLCGLKQESNGQFTLNPAYTTHQPVLIVRVPAKSVGVAGGICQIQIVSSQYLTGN